ncbi:UNVERIFIED_CONTAM: Replication factor C subunit [Sesamum calycinum]|uniref:Aspartic proteinase Asp1 n=1 Tax=Sesamum calycinum TaxID=2727403 RepID=A0AAW2P5Z3_9LAMI
MYLRAVVLFLLTWIAAAAYQHQKPPKSAKASVIFPVSGNVYPKGYYHVAINVGQPPKPYFFDIDTGSDLTWLQCDAPCVKCTPAPHSLYKPKGNLVTCQDPLCVSLHGPGISNCRAPQEQCDYQVDYADHGSSLGVLVKDSFPLKFTNGSVVTPQLAFGCGYNQQVPGSAHLPYVDGVLGLGIGKPSILAQLRDMGLTKNVVGHCLSGKGGGFLFFGDDFLPKSGIVWKPVLSQSKHYSLGPADLQFGGQATNVKGLQIVFDSGSTYTYFSSQAYKGLVSVIKGDLNGKQLKDALEDKSLPLCWKGAKPFKSIRDVINYFKPLVLNFTNTTNIQLQLRPESYLIVTEHGNVCLGILDGGEVGLGNINVIGDISLQDKLVIYDNERQQRLEHNLQEAVPLPGACHHKGGERERRNCRSPKSNSKRCRVVSGEMAEVVSLMDIDDDNDNSHSLKLNSKGKNVVVSAAPSDSKATPWVEKYRPQSLDDVAAHRDIVETIDRLASGNRLPHLLLYGPPGTGKTSTVLALARKLYGNQLPNMVLELNASDDRGIDVVRQQIQDFASTQSISFGAKSAVKLVLLDEADAMTKDAQFALRRVIEKYTKSTRFALICNNVNKIIPALQSRCTRFRFAPLDAVHVTERLKHVINAEELDVPENGLKALVRLSNGDMRKALNILQSTHMASQQISEEAVYLCTGNPLPKDIEQISYWLLNEPFTTSCKRISEIKTRKGLALVDIVREVTMFVFKIKMPPDVRIHLINEMAEIEYRLSLACNDKLQLGSLVAAFTRARASLVAAAK